MLLRNNISERRKRMKKLLSTIIFAGLLLTAICAFPINAWAMQISIEASFVENGNISLEVEPTDRIEDIKAKIYDLTGKAPEKQVLIFADKALEEGNTLQDYSIQKNSVIKVTLISCADNAHVWSGETYFAEDVCGECGLKRSDFLLELTLDIDFGDRQIEHQWSAEPTDTVSALKNAIAEAMGIAAEAQVLSFGDATLANEDCLYEYGLSDGDKIKLVSVCASEGHNWADATCKTPKTCGVCGLTEGETAGHVWTEATCTSPKTCSACGETEGVSAGHKYSSADCVSPKVCSVCGEASGAALGHEYDGDCDGECNRCGATRQSAACVDYNENRLCDVCGADMVPEPSLVGIVGAVLISVAVLALLALVVVFALKKKK